MAVHINPFRKPKWLRAYSFALVTGGLFLLSWALQAYFQLAAMRAEAAEHGQGLAAGDFWAQFLASTFENWQSEFLQLVWQAAGLALFYFWGSSQSREQSDRIEAKLDELLRERGVEVHHHFDLSRSTLDQDRLNEISRRRERW